MHGKWIRRPDSECCVVFVHGILFSSEECWQHENGTYWPELLAIEDSLASIGEIWSRAVD